MKILYVLARELSVFGLPGFRRLRNYIYADYLKARKVNVGNRVRIQPLHDNDSSTYLFGSEFHVGCDCLVDLSGSLTVGERVTLSESAKIFTYGHQIDNVEQDWRKGQ